MDKIKGSKKIAANRKKFSGQKQNVAGTIGGNKFSNGDNTSTYNQNK